MATLTKPRPAVKTARHVNLVLRPNDRGENGIVRISVWAGHKLTVADYMLRRLANGTGRVFTLTRIVGEHTTCRVNVGERGHTCDCKAGKCEHAAAVAKLVQLGRL